MASLISSITAIITALFGSGGWVSQVVTSITAEGNELLLLATVIPVTGLAVGMLKRLLSARA